MSPSNKMGKQESEHSQTVVETQVRSSTGEPQRGPRKGFGRKRKTSDLDESRTPTGGQLEQSTDDEVPQGAPHNSMSSVGGGDGSYCSEAKRPRKASDSRKRCASCNKKMGLASTFTCRCGGNFCAGHRHAESHRCTFDYRTHGRRELIKNNPLVCADKLRRM